MKDVNANLPILLEEIQRQKYAYFEQYQEATH